MGKRDLYNNNIFHKSGMENDDKMLKKLTKNINLINRELLLEKNILNHTPLYYLSQNDYFMSKCIEAKLIKNDYIENNMTLLQHYILLKI